MTYGLELYEAENKNVQTRLWVQMMKISKEFVKQDKCMRKSNIDINDSLKWEEPKQEMFKSAIRLIHKIIKNREASRNNKKAKTAKVEELLRDIPEKSSKKRIIQEKPYLQEL